MKKNLFTFCFLICIFHVQAQIDTEFWLSPKFRRNSRTKNIEYRYAFDIRPTEFNKPLYYSYDFPAQKTIKPVSDFVDPSYFVFQRGDNQWIDLCDCRTLKTDTIYPFAMRIRLSSKSTLSKNVQIKRNLKGRNALGYEFYIPMQNLYETDSLAKLDSVSKPYFLIMATQDSTKVKITPSKPIVGHPAKLTFEILMNSGEIYIAESTSYLASGRLDGSHITSDKPIAVEIEDIRVSSNRQIQGDTIRDQLVSVDKLGTEYVAIKVGEEKPNELFVLGIAETTKLYLDGDPDAFFTIKKGAVQRVYLSTDVLYIKSSAPVYVLQTLNTGSLSGNLLPPISRCTGVNRYQIYGLKNVFVVPSEILNNFEIDGKPLPLKPEWIQPILGLENKYVVVKSDLTNLFKSFNPRYDRLPILSNKKGKFMPLFITDNQLKFSDNYFRFQSDFVNSGGDNVEKTICVGDSLHFEYEPMQGKYLWNTGETSLGIKPVKPGKYWKTTTNGACMVTDTVLLKLQDYPVFSLGKDSVLCKGQQLMLHAPEALATYRWQNGDSAIRFLVKESGTYSVRVSDSVGCSTSDTIKVVVKPSPSVKLKDQVFCNTEHCEIEAKVDSASMGHWSYSGSGRLIFSSSNHAATQASVSKPGVYKLRYEACNPWGCTVADSANITFHLLPQSTFSLDSSRCHGENIVATYTGNLSEKANYHWYFDDCVILKGTKRGPYTVALGSRATVKTFRLWTSENGCVSDTTTKLLTVSPSFGFSTDSLKSCAGKFTRFKAWSNRPDVSYHWTFGSAGTSNLQNPIFSFKQAAQLAIGLTVTGSDGCKNADVMKEKMRVFDPIAQTNFDPLKCYGDTMMVRYTGKNNAGTQLNWDFSDLKIIGKGVDSSYLLDISASKTKKLGLRVVENGCLSPFLSMNIKRKPHLSLISEQTAGCIPLTVDFGVKTKYDDESYQWSLDSQKWKGSPISYTFSNSGRYDLKLEAFSVDGCELSQVYPSYFQAFDRPKVAFDFTPRTTLADNALIIFNNQTSGASRYKWLFGDGQTSTETNPKHLYSSIGTLKIELIAENDYGCTGHATDEVDIANRMVVATAFSPHSNVEKNRIFYPIPQGMQLNEYEFKVFNRWGNVVFSTTDPQKGWDGNLLNGEIAKNGAFVWTVNYRDFSGNEHRSAGTLLVVE